MDIVCRSVRLFLDPIWLPLRLMFKSVYAAKINGSLHQAKAHKRHQSVAKSHNRIGDLGDCLPWAWLPEQSFLLQNKPLNTGSD